jgi:hypothetical protein
MAAFGTAVFAAVAAVSGATVMIDQGTSGEIRTMVAWSEPPPIATRMAREEPAPIPAAPEVIAPVEPPGLVVDGVLVPETELTFAAGYKKRQALVAAKRASVKIVAAAEKAQRKLSATLANVPDLRPAAHPLARRHVTTAPHRAAHHYREPRRDEVNHRRPTRPRARDQHPRDHQRVARFVPPAGRL